MGNAIFYCAGCNLQLRETDFDKGAAFRSDARAWCKACAPEEMRSQPPPTERKRMGETNPIKVLSPSSTRKVPIVPDESDSDSKILLYVGGAVAVIALLTIVALMSGRSSTPRRAAESPEPTPVVGSNPVVPPPRNDKPAEEALKRAREYAQVNPQNFTAQLALFDTAVRDAEGTGHHATAVRERDAVLARQKAAAKVQLVALDGAVRAACDKEEFAAAFKLIDDARSRPMGPDWSTEVGARQKTVDDAAAKLFAALQKDAADARRRGAEDDVTRLTLRVEKWGIDSYRADLARAVAAATPKPKAKPVPPKEMDSYRKKWADAIAIAAGRDYPAALKKLEEASAGLADATVKAEAAADGEILKAITAAQEEGLQLLLKSPKGQKSSLAYLNESGTLVEIAGTLARVDGGQIDLTLDKGTRQIPVGEIAARSLAQMLKGKRNDRDLALLCLLEGDVDGAKTFVPATSVVPDKYWKLAPAAVQAETDARRLFYAAERDLGSHVKAVDAAQKFAALLKDRGETAFVRRNRAFIAARVEPPREYYFLFDDFRVGGGFKTFKGEKEEVHWKALADDGAFVDLSFSLPADVEYRCWVYVGGCCTETVACTFQIAEGTEAPGEAVPVKQLPGMTFKTHASHEGRGRPVPRWGWATIPLPKFSAAGLKRLRILSPMKGFCVAQAIVSSSRQASPQIAEIRDLERGRLEQRNTKADPSLVGHWKLDDGSGMTAVDSGPFGADGKLSKGTWAANGPGGMPALKLDGTGFIALGPDLTMLQQVSGATVATWIYPEKLSVESEWISIMSLSRHNGATPTTDSRLSLNIGSSGGISAGARVTDSPKPAQAVKSAEKPIKLGTWCHLAVVFDFPSHTITLYVNGMPQPTTGTVKFEARMTANTTSTNGAIGSDDTGKSGFFKGMLSDVRLYNRALTKEEIAEIAAPR